MCNILRCSCKNEYQDEKYGTGMRVHNRTTKDGIWRCTVCDTNNSSGVAEKKKK